MLQAPIGVESARLGAFSLKVRCLSDVAAARVRLRRHVPPFESAFVTNQVASQRGCSRNLDSNSKHQPLSALAPQGATFLRGALTSQSMLPTHSFTTPSFTLIILEVVAGQDRIDETARLDGPILDDH